VLVEESVLGWGEFELEVMRDHTDNVVIVCSIENLDPMGVHTGDSVCVAPQQTLPDALYQRLRDQAIAVIRAVGVETGGSNVQFAVNPATEEIVIIEMNPRVSRSSALASKATGFPIAKIAARLAVGYTLQEIPNDITRATPASFEPALDYCVVKWPRFAFEKFPGAESELTTHMKSVGEAMSLGRTFGQAFAKALRSRELDTTPVFPDDEAQLLALTARPGAERFDYVLEALARGVTVDVLHARTSIDPWFLHELQEIALHPEAAQSPPGMVRTYKAVDTCAAEFAARTPYFYSAWERPGPDGAPRHEVQRGDRESVIILGSGPNRIGQGIEFDYCCVHAAQTVRESGRDAVMINCTSSRSRMRTCSPSARSNGLRASSSSSADRPRSSSPPACTRPGSRSSARRSTRSISPRTARASGRSSTSSATTRRPMRPPTVPSRRSPGPRRSASRCSSAPATCSAAGRWRSSTTPRGCRTT
jgi:carbamoyl-phosphate synthase large subunit